MRQSSLLLTGHGYNGRTWSYEYHPADHYVGPLRILGFTSTNSSADGGPAVLAAYVKYLAHHEATAQRLARKFAVRFVSDNPSDELIADLKRAYLDGDSSIKELVDTLLHHEEFRSARGTKWRRPFEHQTYILRSGAPKVYTPRVVRDVWDYGQKGWRMQVSANLPRNWPIVDGYPDTAAYWLSTSAMLNEWNTALVDLYPSEFGDPDWAGQVGAVVGTNVRDLASRMTLYFTGYQWRPQDIDLVSSVLCSFGVREATATDVLDANALKNWFPHAVRFCFASPYAFLR